MPAGVWPYPLPGSVCVLFWGFWGKREREETFFLVMVNSIPTHGFTVNTGGQWSRGWEIGSSISSISSSGPWAEQPGSTVPCCFIPSSCGWQAPERGREEGGGGEGVSPIWFSQISGVWNRRVSGSCVPLHQRQVTSTSDDKVHRRPSLCLSHRNGTKEDFQSEKLTF